MRPTYVSPPRDCAVADTLEDEQGTAQTHVLMSAAAEHVAQESKAASLLQRESQCRGLAGMMSERKSKSAKLNPMGSSGAVNCRTTVSRYFTRISPRTNSNFEATIPMTRSVGLADANATAEPNANMPTALMSTRMEM
jgi:hypothetical protein